jgi:tetratricopeptide (TPR) repeat protein
MAEAAYRRLIEVAPDDAAGYYQLGRILLDRGDETNGLTALHEAQRVEPLDARSWIAEAQWLVKKGRKAEAIEKAQEAVYSEPANQAARDLLDSLKGTKSAPVPSGDSAPPAARDDDADKP